MLRASLAFLALTILGASARAADDPVFSGPQPGEKLSALKVKGLWGTYEGKEVDLVAELKGAPTFLIIVHELTRPASQLLRSLDAYGQKWEEKGLKTHFVWLTADKAKTEEQLTAIKKSLNLKSPLGISLDGAEGPGNYGLNRKVAVTLIAAKDGKVTANFAIVQPNATDAAKVLKEVAKLVDQKAPTDEEIRAAVGDKPRDPGAPDQELAGLMRRMINKDNDEAAVKKVAEEMVKWAGDDAKKKEQLKAYCKKVAGLGYGTEHAQKALKRLGGE